MISYIANIYKKLIESGHKTKEEVPETIRIEVEELLGESGEEDAK